MIKLKLLLALPVVTIAHISKAARPQWAAAIGAGLSAFLSSPSLEMYYLFSLLPKLVLRFPDHKRQLAEPLATVIKRRLDVWGRGGWRELLHETIDEIQVRKLAKPPTSTTSAKDHVSVSAGTALLPESQRKGVLTAASQGAWSKACSRLTSRGLHKIDDSALEKLQALFPSAAGNELPTLQYDNLTDAPQISQKLLFNALKRFPKWSAPGLSGLRASQS